MSAMFAPAPIGTAVSFRVKFDDGNVESFRSHIIGWSHSGERVTPVLMDGEMLEVGNGDLSIIGYQPPGSVRFFDAGWQFLEVRHND